MQIRNILPLVARLFQVGVDAYITISVEHSRNPLVGAFDPAFVQDALFPSDRAACLSPHIFHVVVDAGIYLSTVHFEAKYLLWSKKIEFLESSVGISKTVVLYCDGTVNPQPGTYYTGETCK